MAKRICSIPGCDKPLVARGWCSMHYCRWKKHGDPGEAAPRTFAHTESWSATERLQAVGWDENDRGCWLWRGTRNEKGYGLISLGGEVFRVHRLMWEMHNAQRIPDGLIVRHHCDTPSCVRPSHLEVGTMQQNSQDMTDRERGMAYASGRFGGVCKQGRHDLSLPGALKEVRCRGKATYLTCVECDRDRKRKYQDKKKAEKAAREAAGKKAA